MLDKLDYPLVKAFLAREAQDFTPFNGVMHTGETVEQWVDARFERILRGLKRRKLKQTLAIRFMSTSNMSSPMRDLYLQPASQNYNMEGYLDGKTGLSSVVVDLCSCGRLKHWGGIHEIKFKDGEWKFVSNS